MLSQIEEFVNWVHRRNAQARTWRDYRNDLRQFAAVVGDCDPVLGHLPRDRPVHRPAAGEGLQTCHGQSPPGGHPGFLRLSGR